MNNGLITKSILLGLAVLILVWLLFNSISGGDEEEQQTSDDAYVSSMQPTGSSAADFNDPGVIGSKIETFRSKQPDNNLTPEQNKELKNRFNEAVGLHNAGQNAEAIEAYQGLIHDYPSLADNYLNLAAIYARNQQLQEARETLLAGMAANQKADLLYQSLKRVHGAIAAKAYRKALNTNSTPAVVNLSLPITDKIVTYLDQNSKISELQKQLAQVDQRASSELASKEDQNELIAELKTSLATTQSETLSLQTTLNTQEATFEQEVASLKRQLSDQSEVLLAAQAAEREALARVVRVEQAAADQIAQAKTELLNQQKSLASAQLVASNEETERLQQEREAAERARTDALALANAKAEDAAVKKRQAVDVVNSWAKAWSAQDVSAYVSHYSENYTSNATLSRQQWLAQREVRLKNKKFIDVAVSDFVVKDLDGKFSVTFSQHYQSNTVDDTVRKRLVFEKHGNDWNTAKIVSERIISR